MNQKEDAQELKEKTRIIKNTMKNRGHSQIVPIYKFLYQDSDEKHLTKLQNVLQLKMTDKMIVDRLMDMADQIK